MAAGRYQSRRASGSPTAKPTGWHCHPSTTGPLGARGLSASPASGLAAASNWHSAGNTAASGCAIPVGKVVDLPVGLLRQAGVTAALPTPAAPSLAIA